MSRSTLCKYDTWWKVQISFLHDSQGHTHGTWTCREIVGNYINSVHIKDYKIIQNGTKPEAFGSMFRQSETREKNEIQNPV